MIRSVFVDRHERGLSTLGCVLSARGVFLLTGMGAWPNQRRRHVINTFVKGATHICNQYLG